MARHKFTTGSLCWYCRKVGISCVKPVKGWDAEYNPIKDCLDNDIPSWFVWGCPEFEQDRVEENYRAPARKHRTSKSPAKEVQTKKKKTYDILGEKLTAQQIYRKYGVLPTTFRGRLKRGISPEDAVFNGNKEPYILIGTCIKTKEKRKWFSVREACEDGFGFTQSGISTSCKTGTSHKGWKFEKIFLK